MESTEDKILYSIINACIVDFVTVHGLKLKTDLERLTKDIFEAHVDVTNDIQAKTFIPLFLAENQNKYFTPKNIVKSTCKELELTYKELGEAIGYGDGAIKNASSSGKISEPMQKAIQLYKRTLELEKELENSNKIKSTLKEWLK